MPAHDGADRQYRSRNSTRRELLAVLAAGTLTGLAGCSTGSSGGDTAEPTGEASATTSSRGSTAETNDGGDPDSTTVRDTVAEAGGGEPSQCPSPPFEYERRDIPTYATTLASCEVPLTGPGVNMKPAQIQIEVSGTQVLVSSRSFPDRSVEQRTRSLRSERGMAEVTDRYAVPSGAVVMTTDPDKTVPNVFRTLLPGDPLVEVPVSLSGQGECASTIRTLQTRVIESVEVA